MWKANLQRGLVPVARRGLWVVAVLLVFLLAMEVTCRVEDVIRYRTPFWSTPMRDLDLMLVENDVVRGRPHGRYKQWQLNGFGFRGPEMSLLPPPGCTRIMVLGSSETFGVHESPGKEFPAQLRELLRAHGEYEVVSASLPGMSQASMVGYWSHSAHRFQPEVVVIYASPMFYLGEYPPDLGKPVLRGHRPGEAEARPVRLRAWDHVKDRFLLSPAVKAWSNERQLRERIQGKETDWYFPDVPPDRLALYQEHLDCLLEEITKTGARPVLMTHAFRSPTEPTAQDLAEIEQFRRPIPQATARTIVCFHEAVARHLRALGAERGIPVIDAARAMNGQREIFADLVHFNDAGAARIAYLVCDYLCNHAHVTEE